MSDVFKSKKFKHELSMWNNKLKKSGHKDVEDKNGNLINAEIRTAAYRDRDRIRDFFLTLDCLMTFYPEMPKFERRVMELYSQGVFIKKIVKFSRSSDKHVRNVIKRYKFLVLAIIRMSGHTDNPHSLRLISNQASEVTADAEDRVQNKAA